MRSYQITLDEIQKIYSNARQEPDGRIRFECPVCRAEAHPGKDFTIFANGATSCVRFASAGSDANRDHCRPVREQLGMGKESAPEWIIETLFDCKLTLQCDAAKSDRALTVALNCDRTLARDEINLNRADQRKSFAKSVTGFDSETERAEIEQALLRLAGRRESVQEATEDKADKVEHVMFKELPDGRLIEQLNGGRFVVYDGSGIDYAEHVECEGITYRPISGDPFIDNGDLHLPDQIAEYGNEKLLDEEVENYFWRLCDAVLNEIRYAGKLVRLTYIQDRLIEVPYLHITGPSGSGKTRTSVVVTLVCHWPLLIVQGSVSSVFRICEQYMPTLGFDEFNLELDSEDKQDLVQILNAGFQRRYKIFRTEKGPNGEFVTRSYSPYGVKIFSGLKLTGSYQFERRNIPIEMSVTSRDDIQFCDTGLIDALSAPLREKLLLWRLRNWKRDYNSLLVETEKTIRTKKIMPGFVQIGAPMAMLIDDEDLRDKFISTMKKRTEAAKEERSESLDGQVAQVIYDLLILPGTETEQPELRKWKDQTPAVGDPCPLLCIYKLLDHCADILPENVKIQTDHGKKIWMGKQVTSLGLSAAKIKQSSVKNDDAEYDKKAISFDPVALEKLFRNYSLPIPADFNVPNVPKPVNDSNQSGYVGDIETENNPDDAFNVPELTPYESATYKLGDIGDIENREIIEDSSQGTENVPETEGQKDTNQIIVALDCETEPFNEKKGITPRNAKMQGLALSYDGDGQTNYVTDPEAWPLLAPEPDQTVVMHNAKFDLAVLKRTGLPAPEKWECTLIAAHLLDETGDYGLKPLAKKHLGINNPMTFEEADRKRQLDPPVFEEYAKNDARYTFQLWPKFRQEMEQQELAVVYELEKSVLPVVMAMEDAGMRIDLLQMSDMQKAIKAESAAVETEIYDQAGKMFNILSPDKVAAILFDKLGLPSTKKTDGGKRSVDKEALEEVRGYHPIVDLILRYREIDKLASAFLSTLPELADKHGRVHPEFKQLGTKTGRFSCANPNVQQIPAHSELGKKLRRMFIAEKGNVLVVADWSQMELRILAQYSQDPLLLSAYQSGADTDLHTLTAARMFGKLEADVTKPERAIAKTINFGIAYGITPVGLFNRLKPSGVDVTPEQCEQFIADYFRTYAGVRRFLDQVEPRLRDRGYVRNWFGRRRRVRGRSRGEVRQGQNFIIQSTAADMAKTAMVRLHAALPEGAKLIAMVHDEFIVECRRDQAEEARALMVEIMQTTPEGFTVPMVVEAKVADNWGDAK